VVESDDQSTWRVGLVVPGCGARRTRLRHGLGTASLALVVALHAIGASALDGWQLFEGPGAAFRLEMPAVPSIQTKERGFPPFDFVSTVYTARIGDDAFGLNHTDLPRVALYFKSESSILDSAREGFLEDSNASETAFVASEFAGRPARTLRYDIPATEDRAALRGEARLFFEKNRLYIVWAEVSEAVPPTDVERYFDSVRIGPP